jgi:hypothetical protein
MTIIAALQTYIKTCTELKSGRPVWVNFLGSEPTEYSIVPLPGEKILEEYVNGVKIMEYPFAFQSAESTADDLARLTNAGFYEAFAKWLDEQTESGNLPTLDAGQTARVIEAGTSGYLYEQGVSETGVYQIDCRLEYRQAKIVEESE